MQNPFDWDYLKSVPTSDEVFNAYSLVFLLIFGAGFLIASYLNYRPWTPPIGKYVRRKTVRKACNIALWVFGIGLFFFLIRLLQINPFNLGIELWMWFSIVALIGMLVWFALGFRRAMAETAAEKAAQLSNRYGTTYANPVKRPVRRRRQTR